MSIEDFPDSEEDIVDVVAKAGYLKASNDNVEISLESIDTINIQPKGTIFGAKVKIESDGTPTPMLTFDTKKLRDKNKRIDVEGTVDDALKNFWGD
jgi:hypothetical protein